MVVTYDSAEGVLGLCRYEQGVTGIERGTGRIFWRHHHEEVMAGGRRRYGTGDGERCRGCGADGFANYITSHSPYKVGVYSSPAVWTSIFGTGTASLIPNTYEWTYEPETTNTGNAPYGRRLNDGSGACAQFFGGQTYNSKYALMWQWSGGGGQGNGVGDFDQIDSIRLP